MEKLTSETKRLLEETGANAVSEFYFDGKEWVIKYKNHELESNRFELFSDAYDFLNNG